MKQLVTNKFEKKCPQTENNNLEIDERNLLSVAYKNVVGAKRQSWRTLNSSGEADGLDADTGTGFMKTYREIVQKELTEKCHEVLDLLKNGPIKLLEKEQGDAQDDKAKEDLVFYLKMSGDYYRYLAEVEDSSEEAKNNARTYYNKALEHAKKVL